MFNFFNLFRSKPSLSLNVLFHMETNTTDVHGVLFAENRQLGLRPTEVRFVFEGMRYAPALTPEVLAYIFECARNKGYVPTELLQYGFSLNCNVASMAEAQNIALKGEGPKRSVTYATADAMQAAVSKMPAGSRLQVIGKREG